ncbi:Membrane protein related to metalloendopeptidase [Labilithrix luteola]|uniref:Membrane protein related to metalloendopeptidase n=1 Tax=Labilithrix luteola TaxID=1391654 RepID=A0A0K1QDR6_9BACT|nr:M23 family metallopeptidase [Labilithrix luteola]AKV03580.1 Membrane protein related to metalloendopeptidase [Labilithrix luteola]
MSDEPEIAPPETEPVARSEEADVEAPRVTETAEAPLAPSRGLDRGQKIALGVIAGLVIAGSVLAVVGTRHGDSVSDPTVGAALTKGEIAPPPAAASTPLAEADATVATPVVVLDGGARFTPVWRVKELKSDPAIEIVERPIGKSRLEPLLAAAGLSKAEVKRLYRAFEGVRRLERPERAERKSSSTSTSSTKEEHLPKDSFVLAKDRAKGTVVAFELVTSPVDVWQAKIDESSSDKRLVASKLELYVEHRRTAAAITITADLKKAVAAAGLRDNALDAIDDALEGHVDLAALKPGVRMRVVSTEDWVEGGFARLRIEALEYIPKTGSPLRVYGYERDTKSEGRRRVPLSGFYDAKGQQPYQGAFRSPLPFARVTSRFNPKRMHPVLHTILPHNGVDFGASTGTPVFASAPGTVATVGDGGRCGNMIQIEHANGLTTAYCHLSKFAAGLHVGQHVEPKQLVGYVGRTGSATGPHLHFAVKRGGMFIDPLGLKMDGVKVLPSIDREPFAKHRAELDVVLDGVPLSAPDNTPDDKEESDEPAGEE